MKEAFPFHAAIAIDPLDSLSEQMLRAEKIDDRYTRLSFLTWDPYHTNIQLKYKYNDIEAFSAHLKKTALQASFDNKLGRSIFTRAIRQHYLKAIHSKHNKPAYIRHDFLLDMPLLQKASSFKHVLSAVAEYKLDKTRGLSFVQCAPEDFGAAAVKKTVGPDTAYADDVQNLIDLAWKFKECRLFSKKFYGCNQIPGPEAASFASAFVEFNSIFFTAFINDAAAATKMDWPLVCMDGRYLSGSLYYYSRANDKKKPPHVKAIVTHINTPESFFNSCQIASCAEKIGPLMDEDSTDLLMDEFRSWGQEIAGNTPFKNISTHFNSSPPQPL